jgi:hypothetical protein
MSIKGFTSQSLKRFVSITTTTYTTRPLHTKLKNDPDNYLLLQNPHGGLDALSEPEEGEEAEEVSLEETSMNQLDTSEEKLFAKHAPGMLFSDDGNTPSTSLELRTPESHQCSDEESSDDDDDDFWM